MSIYQVVLISLLTTVLVLVGVALVFWSSMHSWSGARAAMWHGPGVMGCEWTEKSHLDGLAGFVAGSLDLDDAQRPAFDRVMTGLEQTRQDIAARCESFEHPERSDVAFSTLEEWLEVVSSGVSNLRPAFEGFYATLRDDQREQLDGWLVHHDHGSWGRRR